MDYVFKRGQTSVILRAKIFNSTVTTRAGLTALTSASSGLRIAVIADTDSAPTSYTVAGSKVESITTLGTYATPTATKVRFKEVDATNHPGVYEFQFDDSIFAIANAKTLYITISGATNAAQCEILVGLIDLDPYTPTVTLTNGSHTITNLTVTDGVSISKSTADATAALIITSSASGGAIDLISANNNGLTITSGAAGIEVSALNHAMSLTSTANGDGLYINGANNGVTINAGSQHGLVISANGTNNAIQLFTSNAPALYVTGGNFTDGAITCVNGFGGPGIVSSITGDITGNIIGSISGLRIRKNVALSNFEFLMVDSGDHVTAKTGLMINATRSIDGGAFAACTNSASEISSGFYKINLSAADLNGNIITLKFTGSGADIRSLTIITQD